GAAVFQLVPELDAGPVFDTERTTIGSNQTAGHLLETLAESGAALLARVVDDLAAGTASPIPQFGEPTFAPKLTLIDGLIDWSQDAVAIDARTRGVTPEPGAFTLVNAERLKVQQAAIAHDVVGMAPGRFEARAGRVLVGTATDAIELLRVQPAGKREMAAADWWRGRDGAPVMAG
ncbi:MAG: methionyl-tRNA formyltransferase, partial [Pseudolysinimonas sp.]